MTRRCTREGVEWYRRKDRGEDPICDPLATREYTRRISGVPVSPGGDRVGEHLRDAPRLP